MSLKGWLPLPKIPVPKEVWLPVLAKRIVFTILLTAICCFPLYLLSYEPGAPPRHSGGPFPGELSCTESDCHGGIANSGTGSVSISINGMPLNEYRYKPGETVPVAVTVMDPTKVRWGFEITARHSNGCQQAGSFFSSAADPFVIVQQDTAAPAPCPEARIQFPTHAFPKGTAGGGTFELNWTAPPADVGPIVFAAAGNAANGNNGNDGDLIYTTNGTVQPQQGGGTPPPAIDSGGAVLSTGTPVVQQGSATAIITVFGEEFAPEGTLTLNPVVDGSGKVATQLASTCLEINNVRAPMFAVVPTQINAQVPSPELVGPGTASVVVVRNCGTAGESRSSAENLVVTQSTPAFFNFVNNTNGANPIAAVDLGGVLIGEPNLIPGGQFAPAEPGEFISLYGTGFGRTDPAVEAGAIPQNVVADGLSRVVGLATLTIGGIALAPEDLLYVGLAPCCAGLNQVVAKVPASAPDGNLPVVLTINGVSSPQGPYITVRKP
jgi:uncharacterized protein (TIGR03437 family)